MTDGLAQEEMTEPVLVIGWQMKLSFSAGQYFEVKIEYVELTPEEFAEKMTGFTARLDEMFAESLRLESEIKTQLGRVKYE